MAHLRYNLRYGRIPFRRIRNSPAMASNANNDSEGDTNGSEGVYISASTL